MNFIMQKKNILQKGRRSNADEDWQGGGGVSQILTIAEERMGETPILANVICEQLLTKFLSYALGTTMDNFCSIFFCKSKTQMLIQLLCIAATIGALRRM